MLFERRVIAMEGLPEVFPVEMGINLGGCDAFVSEHLLDGAQVGAAFYQVGGKGVAEGMRGDVLGDPRQADQVFEEQEDHHAGELAAAAVEEEDVFIPGFYRLMGPDLVGIDADIFCGRIADGNQSLLIAFADDPDIADFEIETGDAEIDHLADTESAAVHGFEDRLIAATFRFAQIDTADDRLDLVKTKHIGKCSF